MPHHKNLYYPIDNHTTVMGFMGRNRALTMLIAGILAVTCFAVPGTNAAQSIPGHPLLPAPLPQPAVANSMLLVDDDNSDNGNPAYANVSATMAQAIAVNHTFDTYYVKKGADGPNISTLRQYSIVIWMTGFDYGADGHSLTPGDQTNLETYLEEGNSLWLIGDDILYELGMNGFVRDWLHVGEYKYNPLDYPVPNPLKGVSNDTITDGMNFTTHSLSSLENGDAIKPGGNATGIFWQNQTTLPGYYAALRYGLASYRLVFFAFEFASITGIGNRTRVADRVVDWLTGQRDAALAAYPDSRGYSAPGTIASYNFSLKNLGNATDTFDFSVDSIWAVTLYNATSGFQLSDSNINSKPDTGTMAKNYTGAFRADVQIPLAAKNKDLCISQIIANSSANATISDALEIATFCYVPAGSYRAVYIPYLIESNGTNNKSLPGDDLLLYNSARWCANTTGNFTLTVLRSWANDNRGTSTLGDWASKHSNITLDYLDKPGINYTDLVFSSADVLLVSNASAQKYEFSSAEISAISRYVEDGHGIIATYGTIVSPSASMNANLAALFDIIVTPQAHWNTTFNRVKVVNIHHPIAAGLSSFTPMTYAKGAAYKIRAGQNATEPLIAEGYPDSSPVVAYDSFTPARNIRIEKLIVPAWLDLGKNATVKATIRNLGSSAESNVRVNLTVNGTDEDSLLIPSLGAGTSQAITFHYTPAVTGKYQLGVKASPVPGEPAGYTWDNSVEQPVAVLVFSGSVNVLVLRSPSVYDKYKGLWCWGELERYWYDYANLSNAWRLAINNSVMAQVTPALLNASSAEILIAPFCSPGYGGGGPYEFSDDEITAIKGYVAGGRGIVGTFSTLADSGNNNLKLAPLFGLNGSSPGTIPASENYNGGFDLTALKNETVLYGVGTNYTSGTRYTVTGIAQNPIDKPYIQAKSGDNKALIAFYKNKTMQSSGVYFSYPLDVVSYGSRLGALADKQLLYNSIAWSMLNSREHVPPLVNVVEPYGGEVLAGGGKYLIKWSASDLNMASNPINLSYSTSSGSPPWTTLKTNLPNTGSYLWTVPILDSNTLRVRVTAYDNNSNTGSGMSGSNFTIDSTVPFVSVLSPAGGEVLGAGNHDISWAAVDNFGLAANPISINFTTNDGINWKVLASGAANQPPYKWKILQSQPSSLYCRINITAIDSAGNSRSAESGLFTVDTEPPVAIGKAVPDVPMSPGTEVAFNATGSHDNLGITNYTWSFNDSGIGILLYGRLAKYTFENLGLYNIRLTVSDGVNSNGTALTVEVADTQPPHASAGTNDTISPGTQYTFDGSGSTDDVLWLLNYTWTFWDGKNQTIYGVAAQYTFNTPGSFVVTLTVRDTAGRTSKDTVAITVRNIVMPEVVSVFPADGTARVKIDTPVIIDFNKAMSRGSIIGAVAGLPDWTAAWTPDSKMVTLTLGSRLNENTTYTVQLSKDIVDASGIGIEPYSWWFITEDISPPNITVNPVPDAAEGDTVTVSAVILDNTGVANAVLYYQSGSTGTKTSTMMTQVHQPSVYEAQIKGVTPGSWKYYIVAYDASGNTARSPQSGEYEFNVLEKVPLWLSLLAALIIVVIVVAVFAVVTVRRRGKMKKSSYVPDHAAIAPFYVQSAKTQRIIISDEESGDEQPQEVIKPREEKAPDSVPPPAPPPQKTILSPELEETIATWAKKKRTIDILKDSIGMRVAAAERKVETEDKAKPAKEEQKDDVVKKGEGKEGGQEKKSDEKSDEEKKQE